MERPRSGSGSATTGTTANGGKNTSSTVTFKINVTPQNDAPACANATDATFVGTVLNGMLTTCTDMDGNSLGFSLVAPAGHGTAVVNTNGSFTYTPNPNFRATTRLRSGPTTGRSTRTSSR